MRRMRRRSLALMTAIFMLTLPASANMPDGTVSTFNQALQTGDAEIIVSAAKQFGATAITHPEDKQAPIAAFEAGNQLCLWGACADAVPMAEFLQEHEEELPVSRDQVDILAAFAAWSASEKDKVADVAFEDVLKVYLKSAPSLLSLAAYESYAADAVGTEKWRKVRERATLAVQHIEPARDVVPKRWATLSLLEASAHFNAMRSVSAVQEVADIENWLYRKRIVEDVDGLDDVYYTASAWRAAMGAYFRGVTRQDYLRTRQIDEQVEEFRHNTKKPEGAAEPDGPSLCTGRVVTPPRPMYPDNAAYNGYIGAVLLSFDFLDGEPVNFHILAAVPDGEFEQTTLESMKSFEWEWDEEQENSDCTKTKEDAVIYPFEYVMR